MDFQNLGWRNDAPCSLDIAELERNLAQLEQGTSAVSEAIAQVAALYGGEVLPSCYDDWIMPSPTA